MITLVATAEWMRLSNNQNFWRKAKNVWLRINVSKISMKNTIKIYQRENLMIALQGKNLIKRRQKKLKRWSNASRKRKSKNNNRGWNKFTKGLTIESVNCKPSPLSVKVLKPTTRNRMSVKSPMSVKSRIKCLRTLKKIPFTSDFKNLDKKE